MEIWKEITAKCRELIGIVCDECSFIIEEKDIITLKIEDSTYHFCCWNCVHEFSLNELKKEN